MTVRTAHGALTLPGEFYTSPSLFEEERERIFSRSWLCAGHVSQIPRPADYFVVTLDGESLIVTRDREDRVRAFYNVCRHRGTRMCSQGDGHFKGGIQCPYHAWTWGLDGRLNGAPNMVEVPGFDKANYPLHPAASAVLEGLVFINLSPAPERFEDVFGPLDTERRWFRECRCQGARKSTLTKGIRTVGECLAGFRRSTRETDSLFGYEAKQVAVLQLGRWPVVEGSKALTRGWTSVYSWGSSTE